MSGDRTRRYGELLFRRATGEAGEMESAKSLCRLLASFYGPGMRVLDVGCGAGHYLRSLRARLDEGVDYRGIDANERYVELARRAFPGEDRFTVGDVTDLPCPDGSFDVVLCINVIPNLPPPPVRAIGELLRVSARYVVIRALFSEIGYLIRELRPTGDVREADLIAADGTPAGESTVYNNMYTERYYRELIGDAAPGAAVEVRPDVPAGEFDNRESLGPFGTRVEGGRQVSGQLLLDWRYITVRKE